MLVAYGPDGHPVIAEEAALEQLQRWSRERSLYCPNCRGVVHVRGGQEKRTHLHFAHQKGECAWSTEAESIRHATGKVALAAWVREQFPDAIVTLEERLPEPNRIADIFVRHAHGRLWAVEFQCAPLHVEEWHHRHMAYRNAGIHDIWIIGNNRREKQEAFLEAVLTAAQEILFLDPLVTPPRIWLRWPVSRATMHVWQHSPHGSHNLHGLHSAVQAPTLDGLVGRIGYGATLSGQLQEMWLSANGMLMHPVRIHLEKRMHLLQEMEKAAHVNEELLISYLHQSLDEQAIRNVIIPLLHAYSRDPDLFRRYNYGRGLPDQPLGEEDGQRIQKACAWRTRLAQQGYHVSTLQELVKELPYAGPYAAFAGYMEMFITIV
ncbi:MAG TPA: competence protein CoiA family protein [Ktedonobacteraceae bacterium]|nr:competence protein CoiA family protein [Ktedonobacteraceae bacterium]